MQIQHQFHTELQTIYDTKDGRMSESKSPIRKALSRSYMDICFMRYLLLLFIFSLGYRFRTELHTDIFHSHTVYADSAHGEEDSCRSRKVRRVIDPFQVHILLIYRLRQPGILPCTRHTSYNIQTDRCMRGCLGKILRL